APGDAPIPDPRAVAAGLVISACSKRLTSSGATLCTTSSTISAEPELLAATTWSISSCRVEICVLLIAGPCGA
ncbi:MAG: hypothetical protein VXY65_00240, partial [Actinomycetota bacterium]|nr:hypothetical protein [Actinomycetota bacterium]